MLSLIRFVCFLSFASIISSSATGMAQEAKTAAQQPVSSQTPKTQLSVEEINSLLDSIDPYLPEQEVSGEIDIFGSTSMDVLAHRWSTGFKGFHPNVKVVISAEGSESVFDRLARNPSSIGMLSRPVTKEDLANLKTKGLKKPVAIQVAREALGVFVHQSNPLEVITYPQLVTLFCAENPGEEVNWSAAGVTGELAEKPVHVVGRGQDSGTRKFIETYLFHRHNVRSFKNELPSNGEVLRKVEQDAQAIAISEYKFSSDSLRRLKLRREKHRYRRQRTRHVNGTLPNHTSADPDFRPRSTRRPRGSKSRICSVRDSASWTVERDPGGFLSIRPANTARGIFEDGNLLRQLIASQSASSAQDSDESVRFHDIQVKLPSTTENTQKETLEWLPLASR